ncbi:hypothetical protein HK24_04055 [Gluconobacter sp. DsW_058]|nr:hypothetical protein HK24_04055 [Gluconobacter sp. DsW_058]
MTVLCLPADMGTAFAKHLLQQLRDQATDIVLDGGAVKRLGGAVFRNFTLSSKNSSWAPSPFFYSKSIR